MKRISEYNGLVLIDKPPGRSSHDVVAAARRIFNTQRVGHTGTLDPDATGVLVLCLGIATRLAEYLSASWKHYVSEIIFGMETDTQDASGRIIRTQEASSVTEAQLQEALARFRGPIWQVPPMVSAVHHEGKRLYELARAGITVERTARPVIIEQLELIEFRSGAQPTAILDITASTGTYIRTLASDLGTALGVGGTMRTLRRTWVGDGRPQFTIENAHTLEALQEYKAAGRLNRVVLPLSMALSSWPQVRLDTAQLARIRKGQSIGLEELISTSPEEEFSEGTNPIAILDLQGEIEAIGRMHGGMLRPKKVFHTQSESALEPISPEATACPNGLDES